jgi:hypothetical protein
MAAMREALLRLGNFDETTRATCGLKDYGNESRVTPCDSFHHWRQSPCSGAAHKRARTMLGLFGLGLANETLGTPSHHVGGRDTNQTAEHSPDPGDRRELRFFAVERRTWGVLETALLFRCILIDGRRAASPVVFRQTAHDGQIGNV